MTDYLNTTDRIWTTFVCHVYRNLQAIGYTKKAAGAIVRDHKEKEIRHGWRYNAKAEHVASAIASNRVK